MKHRIAFATAAALALTVSLAQPVHAERPLPPPVPPGLEVEEGSEAFMVGHAVGYQNYICLPSATSITGFAWTLFTPEATLFNDEGRQLTTHFFSPNPSQNGAFRPTWQDSRDTSRVWAALKKGSLDSDFVESGAVAWLLLDVVGQAAGPNGGDDLVKTTQIHRVNTSGGVAPATGCSSSEEVDNTAFMPYSADYFFYTRPEADEVEE